MSTAPPTPSAGATRNASRPRRRPSGRPIGDFGTSAIDGPEPEAGGIEEGVDEGVHPEPEDAGDRMTTSDWEDLFKDLEETEPGDVDEIVGDDASEAEDDTFLQGLDSADLFWRKVGSENAEDAKFHAGDRYEPWKAVCNSIALEKC